MTIAEQVVEHHGASAGQLPADVAKAFAAEQRDLAAAGLLSATAGPGDRMPDGNLLDVAGEPASLAEALGSRPGVIVFYRGGWCPYCNIALRTYRPGSFPRWLTGAFCWSLSARRLQTGHCPPKRPR